MCRCRFTVKALQSSEGEEKLLRACEKCVCTSEREGEREKVMRERVKNKKEREREFVTKGKQENK